MRLIDADALIEDLRTQFRDARKILKNPETTELQREMTHIRMGRLVSTVVSISTAPTVDAVPVIRCKDCKDCKHWQKSSINYNEYVCYWGGYVKQEDDFCSWGRKKEKEND